MGITKDAIDAIGALADPIRRRLYEFVSSQPEPVSREAAAAEAEISLPKAKFHLERLVAEGLLETEFRRLTGKNGPGAGRPAKLYRKAGAEFHVSLPPRSYDLAGSILATAIERSADGTPLQEAVAGAARDAGLAAGLEAERTAGQAAASRCGEDCACSGRRASDQDRLTAALSALGYEPEQVAPSGSDAATETPGRPNAGPASEADPAPPRPEGRTELRLRNCPFDSLAQDHTESICGANHAYLQGVIEGLGCDTAEAALDPQPGFCCVRARIQQGEPESHS